MTLPAFNFSQPIVDANGYPTKPMRDLIIAVTTQLNAATALATAAVPSTRNVVGAGGLKGGGALGDDVGLTLYRVVTGVANLPTTGNTAGDLAYATDGRKPAEGAGAGAGTGVVVFWSVTSWIAVTSGVAVTA